MFPSLSQCMCTVFVHFMVCLCACCRLHWSMFTSVRTQVVCENKCACLPWNSSCLGGGGSGAGGERAQQRLSPSGQTAALSSRPWKAIRAQLSLLDLPLPLITELSSSSSTEKDCLRWATASPSQPQHRAAVETAGLSIQWPDISTVCLNMQSAPVSSACFCTDRDSAKVLLYWKPQRSKHKTQQGSIRARNGLSVCLMRCSHLCSSRIMQHKRLGNYGKMINNTNKCLLLGTHMHTLSTRSKTLRYEECEHL